MNMHTLNQTTPGPFATGKEIYNMLPNVTDAFEVTYVHDELSYIDFYNKVYEAKNTGPLTPYRYGSYNIYQADKGLQQY